MRKRLKKILLVSISTASLAFLDCKSSVKNYPVDFVDRNIALAPDKKANSLLLVVEIDESGNLRLNRIEIGTIANVSLLSEKLKAIFEDRARNSNHEREVLIDRRGEIKKEDLERLIECLKSAKASPIRVVKNNLQEKIL
jgi:CHASE2 domain-containing sensor protein